MNETEWVKYLQIIVSSSMRKEEAFNRTKEGLKGGYTGTICIP